MTNSVHEGPLPGELDEPTELKKAITPKLLLLFIVGDILGTGVYALTGKVAGMVGGAGWIPILLAFAVAMVTALSYAEMVTKYPDAAGAALYVHKAFKLHPLTFGIMFAVLSSGITSASNSALFLSENVVKLFQLDSSLGADGAKLTATVVAIAFVALISAVNLWGVHEGVKLNVGLTLIELSGLALVLGVGFFAIGQGKADFSRVVLFEDPQDKGLLMAVVGATALAFFSMVGFEDSVNMAEETVNPEKNFPRALIGGLSITGVIYVVISIVAVAVVPIGELTEAKTPLLTVVEHGAPDIPIDTIFAIISIFAVANTVLINLMMASRLLFGMARQKVLPDFIGKVLPSRRTPWTGILFSALLAFGLIIAVQYLIAEDAIKALGGTTALLLLGAFCMVNVAVLKLRSDKVERKHFRTPGFLAVLGAITSFVLITPVAQPMENYIIAAALLGVGLVFYIPTLIHRKMTRS